MSRVVYLSAMIVEVGGGSVRLGNIVHGENATTLAAHFKPGDTVTIALEGCSACGHWALDCTCALVPCPCAAQTVPQ